MKRRLWPRRLLLILFGALIGLGIAEIALRIIGYSYPEFYVADVHRGYSLRPGMKGWYRKEGEAYVRINSEGLRDREHPKTKLPNTLRIAVLGDSFIEALQVPFEQSFCPQLEEQLRNCPAAAARNVEVINFGVSGYGTAQELITLRNDVWQYSPDVVVLAFTTNNDVTDNSRELKRTEQIPYFVWRDGRLVEDDSFLQTKAFQSRNALLGRLGIWFRDHLRIVQAVQQAAFALRIKLAERRIKSETTRNVAPSIQIARPTDEELGVDNLVYREPSNKTWLDAWTVTEELIKTMGDEVRSHGAKFFVFTLSNPPQVVPDANARAAFLKRVGGTNIFYPDFRIRDFCNHESIPVANLAPPMQKYADEHKVMLHGFGKEIGNGHWNAMGHQVAAGLAAAELCSFLQSYGGK